MSGHVFMLYELHVSSGQFIINISGYYMVKVPLCMNKACMASI